MCAQRTESFVARITLSVLAAAPDITSCEGSLDPSGLISEWGAFQGVATAGHAVDGPHSRSGTFTLQLARLPSRS